MHNINRRVIAVVLLASSFLPSQLVAEAGFDDSPTPDERIDDLMVDGLSAAFGVDADEAEELARLAEDRSRLQLALQGLSGFGGVWLAPHPARLILNVTAEGRTEVLGAAPVTDAVARGVPLDVVESTFDLLTIQRVTEDLASQVPTGVSVIMSPQAGQVTLAGPRVDQLAPLAAPEIAGIVDLASKEGINILHLDASPQLAVTVPAGTNETGDAGFGCTTGFGVARPADGSTAILTAGHCGNSGPVVDASGTNVTLNGARWRTPTTPMGTLYQTKRTDSMFSVISCHQVTLPAMCPLERRYFE